MEISPTNALAYKVLGDTAMIKAQRLTEAANVLLHQAEIQTHIAFENWAKANAITIALDHIAHNPEK